MKKHNHRQIIQSTKKTCSSLIYGMLECNYIVNGFVKMPTNRRACEILLKRDHTIFNETLKSSSKEELRLDIESLSKFKQTETTKLVYDEFMYPSCVKFIDEKIKEIECYLQADNEEKERHEMEEEDYRLPPEPKKAKAKNEKKKISPTIKKLVWNINNGDVEESKCTCCKSYITRTSFNCGHVIAESNGGKTIVSNLAPLCQTCNSNMGTTNMKEFMDTLK